MDTEGGSIRVDLEVRHIPEPKFAAHTYGYASHHVLIPFTANGVLVTFAMPT